MEIEKFEERLRNELSVILRQGSKLGMSILCEEKKPHKIMLDGVDISHKVWAILLIEEKK